MMTYEQYWSALFGDACAAQVVAENALTGQGGRRDLSEWLGHCEGDALEVDQWDADCHERALDELADALDK